MKKLLLFVSAVALTISLNSCSSDSGGGSSVSFKIGGVKKSFKTTAISSEGEISVIGYIGPASDPTEYVSFTVTQGATGDVVDNFSYDNADDSYDPVTFTSSVTTNTTSNAKGTFSGTLEPFFGGGGNITLTEGKFSVKY